MNICNLLQLVSLPNEKRFMDLGMKIWLHNGPIVQGVLVEIQIGLPAGEKVDKKKLYWRPHLLQRWCCGSDAAALLLLVAALMI